MPPRRLRLRPAMASAAAVVAFCVPAAAQKMTLPLWPHGTPEPAQTTAAEANVATATDTARAGHPIVRYSNVTVPTLTVYQPASEAAKARAAALVFPGGGYLRLAWDIEGEDTCRWLNSLDMVCVLVKYRVPEKGYFPDNPADLEDAQQAMRLTRAHAEEWHVDPHRLGVVGFSAGGNLAVLVSTHADDEHVLSTSAAADVPRAHGKPLEAHADFAVLGYPAYLAYPPDMHALEPVYAPGAGTPSTFIVVAEDDHTYGPNSIVYYRALMDAHIPAEFHSFATGGHGFGTFPAGKPEIHWTDLAATWLHTIKMLP